MNEHAAMELALREGTIVSHWARLQPHHPAVVSAHGDLSYAELSGHANQVARLLRRIGLRPGDGVAVLASNRPEFVEILQATQRSGLRLTPINWHLTRDEAAYVVNDSQAKALFMEARFQGIATATDRSQLRGRFAIGGAIADFDNYDTARRAYSDAELEDPRPGSVMFYTSGTTGRPKGVHRPMSGSMSGAALAMMQRLSSAADARAGEDVSLVTGPLYHAAPMMFALNLPLSSGATTVLMDRWDAEQALQLIERHRVTHTHVVPTMLHRMLSLPDAIRTAYDVSSLRVVWHGAAPCPVPLKRAAIERFGPILWEYYGASEGLTTIVSSRDWLTKPGTVGRPHSDEVRIAGDDGRWLGAGQTGTIYLRAPEDDRFHYHGAASKTEAAYYGDYYTLGDLGHLDEDGWLFLTDRTADVIISGGVNIYPAEVEAVLIMHPAVGDVAVIGVPDDEWGESVKAVVETQVGVAANDDLARELMDFAEARLSRYKRPRSVDFVENLPRLDNGKLYKRRLREGYRNGERLGNSGEFSIP